jgi:hypothetical protein
LGADLPIDILKSSGSGSGLGYALMEESVDFDSSQSAIRMMKKLLLWNVSGHVYEMSEV